MLTLNGSSSTANYIAALDSVTFGTTAPTPFGSTPTRVISWSVNDNAGGQSNPSAAVTSMVDLLHTDNAPALSGVANTALATEQTPVLLDGLATVSDAELDSLNSGNGDYAGASLTIARSGGAAADDSFGFQSATDPNNGNTLSLSGGAILSNGVTIATLTSNGGTLTLTFTDAGGEKVTTALANTVLDNITYTNQSDTPPASVVLGLDLQRRQYRRAGRRRRQDRDRQHHRQHHRGSTTRRWRRSRIRPTARSMASASTSRAPACR